MSRRQPWPWELEGVEVGAGASGGMPGGMRNGYTPPVVLPPIRPDRVLVPIAESGGGGGERHGYRDAVDSTAQEFLAMVPGAERSKPATRKWARDTAIAAAHRNERARDNRR